MTRVVQSSPSYVREKTIFGVARQNGANARVCGSWEIDSASGQKPTIISHTGRPNSSVSTVRSRLSEYADSSGPMTGQSNSPLGPLTNPSTDVCTQ